MLLLAESRILLISLYTKTMIVINNTLAFVLNQLYQYRGLLLVKQGVAGHQTGDKTLAVLSGGGQAGNKSKRWYRTGTSGDNSTPITPKGIASASCTT